MLGIIAWLCYVLAGTMLGVAGFAVLYMGNWVIALAAVWVALGSIIAGAYYRRVREE